MIDCIRKRYDLEFKDEKNIAIYLMNKIIK